MGDIENPWHSRPIDVHRWSDHPEVAALCDRVWNENLSELTGRSGPKPRTVFRHQLRVLVLNLYVAWLADPELRAECARSLWFAPRSQLRMKLQFHFRC